ncbi:MAG: PepSY-like domain-containing protein [Lewinellaceae bacterium]|nr:PepSY-like domain-containing protein [Lewinellaceae bacterium]MCB9290544.1 PepSY-like domain-containing protein [Lewinellaceae bacterium]
MKYLMLITVLTFCLSYSSCAQKQTAVPAAVENAFKARFPQAEEVKWDMEREGEWEAEFEMNEEEMSANFMADGAWAETEAEIEKENLPQAVKDAVATQFADYELEEAWTVESPEHPNAYEVKLEKGETTVKATFSPEGQLLGQKTKSEEGEEEEKD